MKGDVYLGVESPNYDPKHELDFVSRCFWEHCSCTKSVVKGDLQLYF